MEMDKSGKYIIVRYTLEGIAIINKYPVQSKHTTQDVAKNLVLNRIRN